MADALDPSDRAAQPQRPCLSSAATCQFTASGSAPCRSPGRGTSSLTVEENCRAGDLEATMLAVLDALAEPGEDPEETGQKVRHRLQRRTSS